jgi:hypothetical protein
VSLITDSYHRRNIPIASMRLADPRSRPSPVV